METPENRARRERELAAVTKVVADLEADGGVLFLFRSSPEGGTDCTTIVCLPGVLPFPTLVVLQLELGRLAAAWLDHEQGLEPLPDEPRNN